MTALSAGRAADSSPAAGASPRPAPPVAVVMTMGALHEGHRTLIRTARQLAGPDGQVVVTVFVNPLQFGAGEDLDRYPRTLDADRAIAEREGADVVFAPTVEEVFPGGEPQVRVTAGPMGELLEGAARPGHFDGMLTVVAKLLHLIAPDLALFGQKDAQQLALIRRMVRDLNFPVEIVGVPTVREDDGLALSSRNRYLDPGRAHRRPCPVPRAVRGPRPARRRARPARAGRRRWRRLGPGRRAHRDRRGPAAADAHAVAAAAPSPARSRPWPRACSTRRPRSNPRSWSTTWRWSTRRRSARPPRGSAARRSSRSPPASAPRASSTTSRSRSEPGMTTHRTIRAPARRRAPGWAIDADVVVVGSGVAGLTAALRCTAAGLATVVVTKARLDDGSTRWAQGGIAAALGEGDTPEQHLDDTLVAGVGPVRRGRGTRCWSPRARPRYGG